MIIKKEEFVKIINSIKETFELSEKITNIIKKSNNDIIRNFCMVPFECHVDNLIKVLSVMFDDESEDIYYFIYELKFGKKYHHGCYTDKNNNNIDLSTPEKLYDRLLKNFNEPFIKGNNFIPSSLQILIIFPYVNLVLEKASLLL